VTVPTTAFDTAIQLHQSYGMGGTAAPYRKLLVDDGWACGLPRKQAEDARFTKRGCQVLELPTGSGVCQASG